MLDQGRGVKRFYQIVSVRECASGFGVWLDDKPVRTPAGQPFALWDAQIAEIVASEWRTQGTSIDPAGMTANRVANLFLDEGASQGPLAISQILAFLATDLLCYWPERPVSLVEACEREWQPVLDWAQDHFSVQFTIARGIVALDQNPVTLARVRSHLSSLSLFAQISLAQLVGVLGSTILALAVAHEHLCFARAFAIAHLDEDEQARVWGRDPQVANQRRNLESEGQTLAALLGVAMAEGLRGPREGSKSTD